MVPEISSPTDWFFCHFGLFFAIFFTPVTAQKIKIYIKEKRKKMPGYIIILHKCTKIIIQDYTVPEIWHMMDVIIFHFGLSFALLLPKKLKFKKKLKKKKKKHLEISFYTSVPKIMTICYTILEIWHVTNVIVLFCFGQFFTLLPL